MIVQNLRGGKVCQLIQSDFKLELLFLVGTNRSAGATIAFKFALNM